MNLVLKLFTVMDQCNLQLHFFQNLSKQKFTDSFFFLKTKLPKARPPYRRAHSEVHNCTYINVSDYFSVDIEIVVSRLYS